LDVTRDIGVGEAGFRKPLANWLRQIRCGDKRPNFMPTILKVTHSMVQPSLHLLYITPGDAQSCLCNKVCGLRARADDS
jgi:hypothetical protein